jgi:hypothetical protein
MEKTATITRAGADSRGHLRASETPPEASLCPIDRALPAPSRAAECKRATEQPGAAVRLGERGEDCERATLHEASTTAYLQSRWGDRHRREVSQRSGAITRFKTMREEPGNRRHTESRRKRAELVVLVSSV